MGSIGVLPYSLGENRRLDEEPCQFPTTDFPTYKQTENGALGVTDDALLFCAPVSKQSDCWKLSMSADPTKWIHYPNIFQGLRKYYAGFVWVPSRQSFLIIGGRLPNNLLSDFSHFLNPEDMSLTDGPQLVDDIVETCAVQINSTHTFYAGGLYQIILESD